MNDSTNQKEYLSRVKKTLEARAGRLTWDELAAHARIEPRALKAYRMPPSSMDYRIMPQLARQSLESLIAQPLSIQTDEHTLVKALASLVISQAKVALLDRQLITGMDQRPGQRSGLSVEERKIMAMVSRFCLRSGLRDFGAEIHELLAHCKQPMKDWLPLPSLIDAGYGPTVLIDPDYDIPTPEAQELASEFSSVVAHLEERLFAALKELLAKYPTTAANDYYTVVREFVVRNPVTSMDQLFAISKQLPGALWMAIQQEFYEPVPYGLAVNDTLTLCAHCNSLMTPLNKRSSLMKCQTRACNASNPAKTGLKLAIQDAKRVKRGIQQYWVEPGIDEIALFDAMRKAGLNAALYPFQDRVDIAVGDDLGIDLKAYVSPEILGTKFKKGLGGLAAYTTKWLVIPDALVAQTPNYLERLRSAMGDNHSRVRCYGLREALQNALKHKEKEELMGEAKGRNTRE